MSARSIAFAVGLAALLVAAVSLAVASGSEPGPSAEDIPAIATGRIADASATAGPAVRPAPEIPDDEKDWEDISAFSEKHRAEEGDDHEVIRPEVRDEGDHDEESDEEQKKREEEAKKRREEQKKREEAPKTDGDG